MARRTFPALLTVAAACLLVVTGGLRAPSVSGQAQPVPLTVEQLKNATYVPEERYPRTPVALRDGVYRAQDPVVPYEARLDERFVVSGDLDGDGAPDAVVILQKWRGGHGPYPLVATFLNRQGRPAFADAVSLGYQYRVESLAIEGRTIVVTAHATTFRGAELTERRAYTLKDTRLVGVRDGSLLIASRGRAQVFSALEPFLAFDISDSFVVMPQFRARLSSGRLDLSAIGYPNAGTTTFLCLANHTAATDCNSDKVIRQRIGGAIEIGIEGMNYPWWRYAYRNEFRKAVSGHGVPLYEDKPEELSWRGMSLAVPILPFEENGNTHVIFVTVRSGDWTAGDEVFRIYSRIKASMRWGSGPPARPRRAR